MINAKTLCLCLSASGALMSSALAQEAPQTPKKSRGLDPEQIRHVQHVGRAVLGAKRSYGEDPEQLRLRDRVEDLRKALTAFDTANIGGVAQIRVQGAQPQRRSERADDDLNDDAPKMQRLRTLGDGLRGQRLRLRQSVDESGERHPHRQMSEAAIRTVAEVEDDLQAVVQGPRELRRQRLNQLRKRLEISQLKTVPIDPGTPSISTLASHRN